MTNAHDSIAQGLKEAIELIYGEKAAVQIHKPETATDLIIQEVDVAESQDNQKDQPCV
ncbi:MAG: hypothetical protein KJ556_00675 [Gammaproteobacteria bacterium]|nr:hypothetical protein [Gammaproteobacteria bacterium]MBU2056577.1 hypothetical protein [Gammaproteobacteria bacterium]MBU2173617.1 hypothetical protein [Gammaproteobacteria bacterium]MBU2246593.1 hypothetical protein [Gammaproteobacteria bacterium]MBU2344515.1 hypothetical protein [Gammaproteobacteria bacterium]